MTTATRPAAQTTLPGPRRIPLVSYVSTLLNLSQTPLKLFSDQKRRFGHVSAIPTSLSGQQSTLLAFGAEYNKIVLSNPTLFHSPNLSAFGDSAFYRLASGLVAMNGERHRQQRRLMMPAFHKQAVAGYGDLMVRYTAEALDKWQRAGQMNLMPELRQLVLRIVSQSLFGLDDPASNEHLGSMISNWTRMGNSIEYHLLPHLRRQLRNLSEELEQELLAVISRKRIATAESDDVLSMLIQAHDEDGTRLTDTELIGQLAILFIAGHETTVNALAWTLILLARYPALRFALMDALGTQPTIEQAYTLPLLDHTIKESMRLFPPVIYTLRISTEPFEPGGYALPKDMMVILSHYITHRLPEIYAEPDSFKPERWETLDTSPYEYLPFSAGPRMCIGAAFASLEMRIVLAMLLARVHIAPFGKIDYQIMSTILRPKGDVPCVVYPASERRDIQPQFGNILELLV